MTFTCFSSTFYGWLQHSCLKFVKALSFVLLVKFKIENLRDRYNKLVVILCFGCVIGGGMLHKIRWVEWHRTKLLFHLVCSRNPEVLWAQRSDKVYLTVALPDAKDISVKCEPWGLFSFSALGAQGERFEFSLELYGKIMPVSTWTSSNCKISIGK